MATIPLEAFAELLEAHFPGQWERTRARTIDTPERSYYSYSVKGMPVVVEEFPPQLETGFRGIEVYIPATERVGWRETIEVIEAYTKRGPLEGESR